jgi:hypothetical protein
MWIQGCRLDKCLILKPPQWKEMTWLAKSAEAINLSAGRMSPSIETPMLVNS